MARRSTGPRYYPSKKAYFANVRGERIKLLEGPENRANNELAQDRYDRLMKVRAAEVEGDRAEVGTILNAYLQNARTRILPEPLSPNTYKMHESCVKDFCNFEYEPGRKLGTLQYRHLKMEHIQRWVTARKQEGRVFGSKKQLVKWSDNYAHMRLRHLRTAFKWAANEGELVSESVFARRGKKARLPSADLSLKRLAITDEEHAALLAQARRRKRGDFAALLELLYHTGARPAEVCLVRADEWMADRQAFVIDAADPRTIGRLKTRRHLLRKGRKRVIRIPDQLVSLVEGLLAKRPEGELIRKEDGKPWAASKSGKGRSSRAGKLADRFGSLIRAANKAATKKGQPPPVREELTLYGYRHAYVTRWLKQGRKPMVLCELLNTSLEMLQAHYSHLIDEHKTLLEEVNQFSSEPQPNPRSAAS